MVKNPMGASSFDKLENAGNLSSKQLTDEQIKNNLEVRITKLNLLLTHLSEVGVLTFNLHLLPNKDQLKQITCVLDSTKLILLSKNLPIGSKMPLTACLNELISLKEGLFLQELLTVEDLTLTYVTKAKITISNLLTTSTLRLENLLLESNDLFDASKFYNLAEELIKSNSKEGLKLITECDEPFVIARVPVVPADSFISVDKLKRAGISCDSLSGYAVINNQLVLGISRKLLPPKVTVMEEANRIRKDLQKHTKTRLHFVSQKAAAYKGKAWFWLMLDKDLNLLTTACPNNQVKITAWGMAFN